MLLIIGSPLTINPASITGISLKVSVDNLIKETFDDIYVYVFLQKNRRVVLLREFSQKMNDYGYCKDIHSKIELKSQITP